MRLRNLIVVLACAFAFVQIAEAQDHWVTTWTAAPQVRLQLPPGGQRAGGPPPAPSSFNDQTVRMVFRTGLGGRRARVTLFRQLSRLINPLPWGKITSLDKPFPDEKRFGYPPSG